ncbi:hypothetical protein JCM8547_004017 [Rhodosporidiobolus lusitaniae]
MKPLRMKSTSTGDEAVLAAQHRAARKSRRRRRERSPESLTPPRRPPPPTTEDWGPDESALPPEQAYKRTRTDDEFYESLADAEAQDRGAGFHEDELYERQQYNHSTMPAYSSYYGSAAAVAAGMARPGFPHEGQRLAQMDEEEYAEHIRAGIWRIKNKEEVERREKIEAERKKREEKERREKELRDREERERIKKLEERRKARNKEQEERARTGYDEAWKKLQSSSAAAPSSSSSTPGGPPLAPPAASTSVEPPSSGTPYPLRFTDFPWPLYPPLALPPLSWPAVTDLTAPAISTFLLDPLPPEKHKATLRQAVLAYHPDRFERLVGRIPEEKEETRERVRELGLRVSQVLNELMKQQK